MKAVPERAAAWCLAVAAVLYQNWLLAVPLRTGVPASGLVSELAASDQPWAWLFRLAETLAGVLAVIGGSIAARCGGRIRAAAVALAGFGVAVVAAASLPLTCAPSLQGSCDGPDGGGILDVLHATASGLGDVLLCLGGLLLVLVARSAGDRRTGHWLAGCVLLVLVVDALIAIGTVAVPMAWIGYVQRIGILGAGGVLVAAIPALEGASRVIDRRLRGI